MARKVRRAYPKLATTYPTTGRRHVARCPSEEGTVYLFADGFAHGSRKSSRRKAPRIRRSAVEITFSFNWTALPTVTATAKPAWMPLAEKLGGPLEGTGFQAKEQSNGQGARSCALQAAYSGTRNFTFSIQLKLDRQRDAPGPSLAPLTRTVMIKAQS